jgi:hypothetical protein
MKKLPFILLIFIFASSASAAVYKWVDEGGAVNFADDYSKVPPDYRNKVEEVSIPKIGPSTSSQVSLRNIAVAAQSGETATQVPPIAQTLIREGDFAIKLAEALKTGGAKSEAEAESMLASVGISPKNGWIADYPVTPDIIGELQNAIGAAVDSGNLKMTKNEAITALQDLAVRQGLPVRADIEGPYAGVEPPRDYGEYSRPEVINNYYYNQGPPIVTYYPPPPDYYYLYAWVPSTFWCSGFFFPGFFILHDFHKTVIIGNHRVVVSNHVFDRDHHRFFTVDPVKRRTGESVRAVAEGSGRRPFATAEARKGAQAIFQRSRDRMTSSRGLTERNFATSKSGSISEGRIPTGRNGNIPSFNGRGGKGAQIAPREHIQGAPKGSGMSFGAPGRSEGRSFSPPSSRGFNRPSENFGRSFSPPSRSFSASPTGGRSSFGGFYGGSSGDSHGGGFARGGRL